MGEEAHISIPHPIRRCMINTLTGFTLLAAGFTYLFPGDYLSVISCYYQVLVEVPPTSAAQLAIYASAGVRAYVP